MVLGADIREQRQRVVVSTPNFSHEHSTQLRYRRILHCRLNTLFTPTEFLIPEPILCNFRPQFNLSPMVMGLMFVINGGMYAVSAPLWGWLCDRPAVRPKWVTVVGCGFIAAAFLLVGPAPVFVLPKFVSNYYNLKTYN